MSPVSLLPVYSVRSIQPWSHQEQPSAHPVEASMQYSGVYELYTVAGPLWENISPRLQGWPCLRRWSLTTAAVNLAAAYPQRTLPMNVRSRFLQLRCAINACFHRCKQPRRIIRPDCLYSAWQIHKLRRRRDTPHPDSINLSQKTPYTAHTAVPTTYSPCFGWTSACHWALAASLLCPLLRVLWRTSPTPLF